MPSDYVSGMAVSAIVEGSGAGNVYSDNTVYYGSIGEIRTAHNNAIGPGAVAISGTVLHAIQTVTPNALAAADHLMFRYYRYGADALDTIDGIMYFFGWLVTYTADS